MASKNLPKATRSDSERRVRQADRLARLFRVLERIQGRGRWTAKDVAADEECSERTIFRALESLELAGVPWYFDEIEKCYRVRPDYRFPTLNLSPTELVDQVTASAIAAAASATCDSLATTKKLRAAASEDTSKVLNDAEKLISILGLQMAEHGKHHAMIQTAQRALIDRTQLTGRYKSPYDAKQKQLRLTPYRLALIKQAWYLIAVPAGLTEPHTYRVARFKSLRQVEASAQVPSDFDLKEYFGNAWTVYRGEPTYDVEIEFTRDAADIVTETVWHSTQRVSRKKDGAVSLHFRVDGLDEIVHWVASWSGRAKVIRPVELKMLVVESLQAGIDLHAD